MAIHILSPDTDIRPGQFVCAGQSAQYGLNAGPREVLEVKANRVYLVKGARTAPTFLYRCNLLYACDTKAEADAVFELTRRREHARQQAMEQASRAITAAYAFELRTLLGLGPAPSQREFSEEQRAAEVFRAEFEVTAQQLSFDSGDDVFSDHHDGKAWNELVAGEYDNPVLRDAWAVFCAARIPPGASK
jgi:hypothetical protein